MKKKTETTKEPAKPKAGRPTKFTPAMIRQVRFLTARGATDEELAGMFEVSRKTLNAWKKHPEFRNTLKEGKAIADSAVMRALYQRAIGYSHPDSHVSSYEGEITVTPIVKHYPPETVACIFWLKNRDPENWRDKHTVDVKSDLLNNFFAALTTKTGIQNDT